MFIEGKIILLFMGIFLAMEIVMLLLANRDTSPKGLSKETINEARRQRSLLNS